jgi:hypothetical protein
MADSTFRPKRPTEAKQEAKAAAAKLAAAAEGRLSVRFSADSLHAIKLAAVTRRLTVKKFVAKALAAAGAEISDVDLHGD